MGLWFDWKSKKWNNLLPLFCLFFQVDRCKFIHIGLKRETFSVYDQFCFSSRGLSSYLCFLSCFTGIAFHLFPSDWSEPGWSPGAWDCPHVQDRSVKVWIHSSQLDTEVCHGLMSIISEFLSDRLHIVLDFCINLEYVVVGGCFVGMEMLSLGYHLAKVGKESLLVIILYIVVWKP